MDHNPVALTAAEVEAEYERVSLLLHESRKALQVMEDLVPEPTQE